MAEVGVDCESDVSDESGQVPAALDECVTDCRQLGCLTDWELYGFHLGIPWHLVFEICRSARYSLLSTLFDTEDRCARSADHWTSRSGCRTHG